MAAERSTHRPLTYGDLPDNPPPGVCILCSECDAIPDNGYAASRGDYWYHGDDEPVLCSQCGEPMELIRRVVVMEAWRKH
jgi:hypothetical protein